MGKELNGILEEVLNMPQQQRAFLASQLIDSLEPQVDIDIEAAWQQEVNKRVSQAKEGLVTFIPWGEARCILISPCSGSDSKLNLTPEEKAWIKETK